MPKTIYIGSFVPGGAQNDPKFCFLLKPLF